jgi:hypothetical protein
MIPENMMYGQWQLNIRRFYQLVGLDGTWLISAQRGEIPTNPKAIVERLPAQSDGQDGEHRPTPR